MASSKRLSDFRAKIDQVIQDDANVLSAGERDAATQEAVYRYSLDKPDITYYDFSGTGSAQGWALPSTWVTDFSQIEGIEYPSGERPPDYLELDDYYVYPPSGSQRLELKWETPSSSETVRMAFTIPHVVSDTSNTIPDSDYDAVCNLAAAMCCRWLANRYTQTTDSTLSADVVSYRTKGDMYASRAKDLLTMYKEHMGITEAGAVAASSQREWDTTYQWGSDFIWHPKRWR